VSVRATDRELITASNALHALLRCGDLAARLEANRYAAVDAYEALSGGFRMPHVDEPATEHDVLKVAVTLSHLLTEPDNTDCPAP
jgi:hypothetical protein